MAVLRTRIVLGGILLAGVGGLFLFDAWRGKRLAVPVLVAVLGLLGFGEFARMARLPSACAGRWLTALGFLGTGFLLAVPLIEKLGGAREALVAGGLVSLLALAFGGAVLRADFRETFEPLAHAVLGVLLFGLSHSFLLRIYFLGDDVPRALLRALVFCLGVKGTDIAAYLAGSALGRNHFLKVSPGKTLEGSIAAFAFSTLWFTGAGAWWPEAFFGWPWGIASGIILAFASQLGDLTESLLKRTFGVKDSASLLPEFGGVLDLVDSFIYSGFLFWCLLRISA